MKYPIATKASYLRSICEAVLGVKLGLPH